MVSKVVSPLAVKVGWKWVSCGQESKAQRCVLRDPFAMLTPGAKNEKSELLGLGIWQLGKGKHGNMEEGREKENWVRVRVRGKWKHEKKCHRT